MIRFLRQHPALYSLARWIAKRLERGRTRWLCWLVINLPGHRLRYGRLLGPKAQHVRFIGFRGWGIACWRPMPWEDEG
jgi:hypothetical protein